MQMYTLLFVLQKLSETSLEKLSFFRKIENDTKMHKEGKGDGRKRGERRAKTTLFILFKNGSGDFVFTLCLIERKDIINSKSSAIRQKSKSQNECYKKVKHAKFCAQRTFLTPTHRCNLADVAHLGNEPKD